jgi:Reverse transcriptase (RNA-dependent DNA polymerase)
MPVRFEQLLKPGGGFRLLSRLDPADLKDLQRIVVGLGPRIEASLGPEVRANRILGRGPALAPWGPARGAWAAEVDRRLRSRPRSVLVADVRDCYASIRGPALAHALRRSGAREELVQGLLDLLAHLADEGIQGLPVGPEPSAVLANVVLACGDRALRKTGTSHLRWVDDFVVSTTGRLHSIRALDALRRSLGEWGLELNEPKTAILDPGEARARLLAGELPASGAGRGMMPAP